jgi:hypothetical protein
MARWVVAPVACIWRTMGSTLDAKASAAFWFVTTPLARLLWMSLSLCYWCQM